MFFNESYCARCSERNGVDERLGVDALLIIRVLREAAVWTSVVVDKAAVDFGLVS